MGLFDKVYIPPELLALTQQTNVKHFLRVKDFLFFKSSYLETQTPNYSFQIAPSRELSPRLTNAIGFPTVEAAPDPGLYGTDACVYAVHTINWEPIKSHVSFGTVLKGPLEGIFK